jgi:uncharacterized protein involved in exopolysaccharide biosynthesis
MSGDNVELQTSLAELAIPVLRRRYLIVVWTAVGLAVGGAVAALAVPKYTATVSFLPEVRQQSFGIAALASQFGVQVPQSEPTESPEYYASLLESKVILGTLAAERFAEVGSVAGHQATVPLTDLLRLREEADERIRLSAAVSWLRNAMSTSISRTGIVTVRITSRYPELSHALAERVLALINDFNVETRQSRAAAERRFIEGRVLEAGGEVGVAEQELELFLERNRQYRNAPQLVFEFDRLQRRLAMHQERLISLTQALEEARISEIRDTPVITVIDPPELPLVADPQTGLVVRSLLGGVAGSILGVLFVLLVDVARRASNRQSEPLKELAAVWRDVIDDFRVTRRRARRRSTPVMR